MAILIAAVTSLALAAWVLAASIRADRAARAERDETTQLQEAGDGHRTP
ncbi:hypothetical protein ABH930_000295 [Kitasatospora sp. GAS204A]|nr:hypothetical protein [Kitasatospora sp. GAS204B]MDH6116876.1 hypothetical protein [Kitasatospora sp. GAS204B]